MPKPPVNRSWLRLFAVAAALPMLGLGPCGPIAGGRLPGDDARGAVSDWTFANDVPRCAVEVQPADPHSVTVNCMAWAQRLFVSCSECAAKTWSALAVADGRGRVRVGDAVYPVALARVEDPGLLDSVWKARAQKLGDPPSPRPDGWWTFELRSR